MNALKERLSKVENDYALKKEKMETMRCEISEIKDASKSWTDVCNGNVIFDSPIMQAMAHTKNVENLDTQELREQERRSKNIVIHAALGTKPRPSRTPLQLLSEVAIAMAKKKERKISITDSFTSSDNQQSKANALSIDIGKPAVFSICIVNNGGGSEALRSIAVAYTKPKGCFSLTFTSASEIVTLPNQLLPAKSNKSTVIAGPFVLPPASQISFQVSCVAKSVGLHKAAFGFNFKDLQKIWRYATLVAEDDVSRPLAPSQPYARPIKHHLETVDKFVPGLPPPVPHCKSRLKQYPLPQITNTELPVFLHGLSYESYKDYFTSLIYVEELQWKIDICEYDLENAIMQPDKQGYLVLTVPGLLERRPSVIYGDTIFVRPHGSKEHHYQGFVHRVQAEEVLLKFHPSFHRNFIAKQQYKVRFSYSRTTIRRSIQAIEAASTTLRKGFLFPDGVPLQTSNNDADVFLPINRDLNEEQRSCVSEILKKAGGPPYLIHGPPGTGKTVTVVEAVLQVLKRTDDCIHVLACAPSNAAADVILDRLRGRVQVRDMLRLNAYTRHTDDVAAEMKPYCHIDGTFFGCPPLEKLVKYKVVVSTYFSAYMLGEQPLERGHFSHIFLDEAGQAMEPEALVALAKFTTPSTVVVLAGDHLQLGPVVRSSAAVSYGLGTSLLERLMGRAFYSSSKEAQTELNRAAVTRLVRNYRSHEAILEPPSRLFYKGELKACGSKEICRSMCGWEELPNKEFPVLFVGVEGVAAREAKSPSWFNAQEVSKVIELVGKLKKWRRNRLLDEDIGIISPYSQQVKKIKSALASKNMMKIKAGSVEQFQGQEKRVIIISTVRSTTAFLELDEDPNFPFLHNPKRFNVAVTRAKALLIVIGNPHVLDQHDHWKELLQYCMKNKSYVGCTPPALNREMSTLKSCEQSQCSDLWIFRRIAVSRSTRNR
ncbi:hypothetical protein L7F22_052129 [Adiantum nelumboides]|nr:hypothetical protein [Adiantum nelumboides]